MCLFQSIPCTKSYTIVYGDDVEERLVSIVFEYTTY